MAYSVPSIYGQAPSGGGGNQLATLLQSLGIGALPTNAFPFETSPGQNGPFQTGQNMYARIMQMMGMQNPGQYGGTFAWPQVANPRMPGPAQAGGPAQPASPTGPPAAPNMVTNPTLQLGNFVGPGKNMMPWLVGG